MTTHTVWRTQIIQSIRLPKEPSNQPGSPYNHFNAPSGSVMQSLDFGRIGVLRPFRCSATGTRVTCIWKVRISTDIIGVPMDILQKSDSKIFVHYGRQRSSTPML